MTLVELLVVLGIIGLLTAVLLPAVQATREAGRRTTCANHLKQCATAILLHEDAHGHVPTGGWSKNWTGLPGRGFGGDQPGGWIYNILPYIDQGDLRELGVGGSAMNIDTTANALRLRTPLAVLNCPTRRASRLFANSRQPHDCDPVSEVARNDYAINGGDWQVKYGNGPKSLGDAAGFEWPDMSKNTGLSFQRSAVRLGEVTDGTSSTYLVAEKHLRFDYYDTGTDKGDNESQYSGDDLDLIRFTGTEGDPSYRPLSDRFIAGEEGAIFGSAHADGFGAALCDGSVRTISYAIDPRVHSRLGNRRDGKTVEW